MDNGKTSSSSGVIASADAPTTQDSSTGPVATTQIANTPRNATPLRRLQRSHAQPSLVLQVSRPPTTVTATPAAPAAVTQPRVKAQPNGSSKPTNAAKAMLRVRVAAAKEKRSKRRKQRSRASVVAATVPAPDTAQSQSQATANEPAGGLKQTANGTATIPDTAQSQAQVSANEPAGTDGPQQPANGTPPANPNPDPDPNPTNTHTVLPSPSPFTFTFTAQAAFARLPPGVRVKFGGSKLVQELEWDEANGGVTWRGALRRTYAVADLAAAAAAVLPLASSTVETEKAGREGRMGNGYEVPVLRGHVQTEPATNPRSELATQTNPAARSRSLKRTRAFANLQDLFQQGRGMAPEVEYILDVVAGHSVVNCEPVAKRRRLV